MKKIIKIISVFLCLIIAFNTVSVADVLPSGNKKPDALSVDVVHGIVAGETIPIHAFSDGILLKNITLTSSNTSVISCSPGGHITGEKAGESADITCTSQDGSSKTFTVYCVSAVYPPEECTINSLHNPIYAQPKSGKILSMHVNLDELGRVIKYVFYIFALVTKIIKFNPLNSPDALQVFTFGNFKVYGQYGNFAYIRFDDTPSSDGFISYSKLSKRLDEFLYISDSSHTIKVGEQDEYLTADYYDKVTWEVENDKADDGTLDYEISIIDFDPGTGKIKAKKGGITSIRATANGMGRTCDIVSIYMWPQEWKVTAEKKITLYEHPDIVDINYEINEGDTFWVVGDLGGSNSWCYINRGSQAFPEYSYAKIEDFSTKGTISQYNELGWSWPVKYVKNGVEQTQKAKYIQSPYGWRDTNPARHKGIDISKVDEYEVVSAFAGKVIYVYDDADGYKSCGNCVAISSTTKDPVTGEYLVAIYMHLKSKPKVSKNQYVSANQLLGYVGNTGNSTGPHLHFEVNTRNLSYGEKLYYDANMEDEMVFSIMVNPLYFYMDYCFLPEDNSERITINPGCDAMKYRKPFWYGDDAVKEKKEP